MKSVRDVGEISRSIAYRFDGSFTRQDSTISLNAREYLCWPPVRSTVGGAP